MGKILWGSIEYRLCAIRFNIHSAYNRFRLCKNLFLKALYLRKTNLLSVLLPMSCTWPSMNKSFQFICLMAFVVKWEGKNTITQKKNPHLSSLIVWLFHCLKKGGDFFEGIQSTWNKGDILATLPLKRNSLLVNFDFLKIGENFSGQI